MEIGPDAQVAVALRPARAADQAAITALVRRAGIYPRHLDWPRFIVAEHAGRVIGVGQVKPHGDGSRELASIAVQPGFRGRGVGTAICRALVARETGPLYLICRSRLETYYARFGFRQASGNALSPHFRRMQRLARLLAPATSTLAGLRLIVMKKEAP